MTKDLKKYRTSDLPDPIQQGDTIHLSMGQAGNHKFQTLHQQGNISLLESTSGQTVPASTLCHQQLSHPSH
jgi:hypothetical protein